MPSSDNLDNTTLRSFYLEAIRPDMERIVQGSENRLREELVGTLRQEIGGSEARLRDELVGTLRQEIGGSEARLRDEFVGTLRQEIGGSEARLRQEIGGSEARLRQEIARSEGRLHDEIVEFRRDVDGHFDALYHRLDRLETEYHMLVEGLRRVEQAIGDSQARPALRAEIAELRARVTALAERLTELETKISSAPRP